jgi:hypothetical protein
LKKKLLLIFIFSCSYYANSLIAQQNNGQTAVVSFINYSQKYNKLILDNTRINLKIKENFSFLKINLNLGFLAKHLTYNQNDSLNLDFELEKTQDLIIVEEELRRITKKYYKYRVKGRDNCLIL